MNKLIRIISALVMSIVLVGGLSVPANAASQALSPLGKVSFTFDDGYASAITQAAPILSKYGIRATDYVITGCIGMTTTPNKCAASKNAAYMSWTQLAQLQTSYGWEIGSHTVTHPYLSRAGSTKLINELSASKAALAAHGINATYFATPYGDYNNKVLSAIAKYYYSQRGYADIGYNVWPYSDYYLKVQPVKASVTLAMVQGYINTAMANHYWLILVFHDIRTKVGTNPDQDAYSASNLEKIAAFAKSQGVLTPTIQESLARSDQNLMPNSSFNDGIADGWSTNSPSTIAVDTLGNGSYPDITASVKLTSAPVTRHLFSPLIAVNPASSYLIKNYLSVQQNNGGLVGFYIDEYNSAGNWISGQYKATEASVFTEELNFAYHPSSAAVTRASLQVIVSTGGVVAYLDNVQWLPLQ